MWDRFVVGHDANRAGAPYVRPMRSARARYRHVPELDEYLPELLPQLRSAMSCAAAA